MAGNQALRRFHGLLHYHFANGTDSVDGSNVHIYLGSDTAPGVWQRFEKDVMADWNSLSSGWQETDGLKVDFVTGDEAAVFDDIRFSNCMTKKVNAQKPGLPGQITTRYMFPEGGYEESAEWLHYDRIGNCVNISGENGSLDSEYNQDSYGNLIADINTGEWSSVFSQEHLTTKPYDPDSELYYFYSRWYDPQVGVFVSKDPGAISDYYYSFAMQNPVIYVDPFGEAPMVVDIAKQTSPKAPPSNPCKFGEDWFPVDDLDPHSCHACTRNDGNGPGDDGRTVERGDLGMKESGAVWCGVFHNNDPGSVHSFVIDPDTCRATDCYGAMAPDHTYGACRRRYGNKDNSACNLLYSYYRLRTHRSTTVTISCGGAADSCGCEQSGPGFAEKGRAVNGY